MARAITPLPESIDRVGIAPSTMKLSNFAEIKEAVDVSEAANVLKFAVDGPESAVDGTKTAVEEAKTAVDGTEAPFLIRKPFLMPPKSNR